MVLAVLMLAFASAGQAADYKVGVMAPKGAEDARKEWQPLMEELSKSTGDSYTLIPLKFKSVDGAIKSGSVQYFLGNPMVFLKMEKKHGLKPLACIGKPFFGEIFVPAGSDIKSLQDLKGKKIAAAQPNALMAYASQMYALQNAGITKADFAELKFTGKIPLVIKAVLGGSADAGFVKGGVLAGMVKAGKLGASDYSLIEPDVVGKMYPNWVFSNVNQPEPEAAKVKEAVLSQPDFIEPQDLTSIQQIVDAIK